MSRRWGPGILFVAGIAVLGWAAPKWHPATALRLQFDRAGYIEHARAIASEYGDDLAAWPGFARLNTSVRNQQLRRIFPGDELVDTYPAATVEVTLANSKEAMAAARGQGGSVKINTKNAKGENRETKASSAATVTLRTDGSAVDWKLPTFKQNEAEYDNQAAAAAMRRIAGAAAAKFTFAGGTTVPPDGTAFKWRRAAQRMGEGPEITIELAAKNGALREANTEFAIPDSIKKRLDAGTAWRVAPGVLWFLLVLVAIAIPVVKEGGASLVRVMKDASAIRLSVVVGLLVGVAALIEWNDQTASAPGISGVLSEVWGVLLGVAIVGVLFYLVFCVALLNVRMQSRQLRGLRLLGTKAFFSRMNGAEILAGLLVSPALAAVPYLIAAIGGAAVYKNYDDPLLLAPFAVLTAFANAFGQESTGVLAMAGTLFPLAPRYARREWLQKGLLLLFGTLTCLMLSAPFRDAPATNLVSALCGGGIAVWLFTRFGVLGLLTAFSAARLINLASAMLLQPAAAISNSGMGILAVLAAVAFAASVAAWKGSEVVAELYGEAATRSEGKSRREEILQEFSVARSAQQQMLPSTFPSLPGYTISASCDPAREVGGDLYDFLPLRDGRIGIGVADVSGKGVPAALYMTLTKGLLCAAAQDSDDPRVILGVVNTHLREVARKKMFVTMALGVLDPAARTMEYARAGHNPVVWLRAGTGETKMLDGKGIGLGIAPPLLFGKTLAVERLQLEPGDALVFYSDGLTEAMNAENEQFGDDRLIEAVAKTEGMHATDTRDSILEEVRRFLRGVSPQDDLTIAVLRVNAN